VFESACVLRAIPDVRNPSQSITIHHNSSQSPIHHNPSQSIAIHVRNPSQRQARWYQVLYQVGYQDGHHRIGIRFELTQAQMVKCSNRNRIGAYLLATRRLSVRSGGFGDVLQTDRG
jgi:hypothetical protein